MKLNAKAALRAITHNEMIELQELSKKFLVPQPGEKLRKLITLDQAEEYYLNAKQRPFVKGFIAKAKDYEISSSDNMIEYLRLDYKGTGFNPNEGFAVIEFPTSNGDKVIRPFEHKNILGDNPPPYTHTGMSGSSKTIIPEYYLPEAITLPEDTQLTIYNRAGNPMRQYELKIKPSLEKEFVWYTK